MGDRLRRVMVAAIVLMSILGPGVARAGETPSQFVRSFLGEAFALFRTQIITPAQRRDALRDLFAARMDIPHMARYMTLDRVSGTSPEARRRFERLLVGYLVDTFYDKIARGAAGSFDASASQGIPDSGVLDVDSTIRTTDAMPEQVTWRLRRKGDSYNIIDAMSDGVSLAAMHRAVFGAVMLAGGLPRLEEMLAARQ